MLWLVRSIQLDRGRSYAIDRHQARLIRGQITDRDREQHRIAIIYEALALGLLESEGARRLKRIHTCFDSRRSISGSDGIVVHIAGLLLLANDASYATTIDRELVAHNRHSRLSAKPHPEYTATHVVNRPSENVVDQCEYLASMGAVWRLRKRSSSE